MGDVRIKFRFNTREDLEYPPLRVIATAPLPGLVATEMPGVEMEMVGGAGADGLLVSTVGLMIVAAGALTVAGGGGGEVALFHDSLKSNGS